MWLFKAFPSTKNGFKIGMKLEGIDPVHPSLYCVLSVAEVKGHRLRLHFDGYSECYDFWTNADSPFIFPVGWVEKNGRELQPPLGTCCIIFSMQNCVHCIFSTTAVMFVDEIYKFFRPPPVSERWWVRSLSMHVFVGPFVHPGSLSTRYLINQLDKFHEIYNLGALSVKDELIWILRSKGQRLRSRSQQDQIWSEIYVWGNLSPWNV